MPFGYTLIFIALAVVFGFICKKPTDVYFTIALDLFLCILTYSIYHICKIGLNVAFIGNIVDISYFLLCIPFVLLFFVKNQQFTAKIQENGAEFVLFKQGIHKINTVE
ncbi:hypothetical protein FACS1894178_5780 [Bacteroidia bacterium]|nr:hypothetical protein FACS1894178_5780 [Bacteroidia bacterium]